MQKTVVLVLISLLFYFFSSLRRGDQSTVFCIVLFQNDRHFSVLLFTYKLALVASFLNSKFNRIFSFKRGNKG